MSPTIDEKVDRELDALIAVLKPHLAKMIRCVVNNRWPLAILAFQGATAALFQFCDERYPGASQEIVRIANERLTS